MNTKHKITFFPIYEKNHLVHLLVNLINLWCFRLNSTLAAPYNETMKLEFGKQLNVFHVKVNYDYGDVWYKC